MTTPCRARWAGHTACNGSSIMPVGTVAHETGHAFGLPDLYDTNLRSPLVTQGIGEWGIMGSGNYTQPYSPSRFEAWSLAELGWVAIDTLGTSRSVRSESGRNERYGTLHRGSQYRRILPAGEPAADRQRLLRKSMPSVVSVPAPVPRDRVFWCGTSIRERSMPGDSGWEIGSTPGRSTGLLWCRPTVSTNCESPAPRTAEMPGILFPGRQQNHTFSDVTLPASVDNQGATAGFTAGLDLPGQRWLDCIPLYQDRPRAS